jgi:GAF domain-containing protein/anti-sigma regulatory factor (Ser/Thr protein kinase)
LAFVYEVAGIASTSLTRKILAERFCQAAARNFCDVCAVHVLDGDGTLTLEAICDGREQVTARAEKAFALALAQPGGFIHEAMRTAQPLLFQRGMHGEASVTEPGGRTLQFTATRSMIVVPLSIGSTCVGTLSFLEASLSRPYGVEDLDCAAAVARQIGVSLENVRFREQERRITERARFLGRATEQLLATSDTAEMIDLLLNVIVEDFADWALAVSLSSDGLDVIDSAESATLTESGTSRLREGRVFGEAAEKALVAAVRGQRPIFVNEISKSPGTLPSYDVELEPRAWMMVPLHLAPGRNGGIVCYSTARRYDENDLEILQELARRTALALEYAEGFARERRLTHTLQQATLPTNLSAIKGAELSAVYQPAAKEEQVGGDWYDSSSVEDGRVLLSIGDVTGHGLQASVVMAKLRHALNVIALYESDPARVLDVAERVVLRRFPGAIATAFIGFVDRNKNTITYANAGHPYPLVRRKDGSIRTLQGAEGLPIGLRDLAGHEKAKTESLEDVDLLLLYTDGLSEATRDAVAGEQRLIESLGRDTATVVKDTANFIRATCLSGAASAADDVAALTVNFTGIKRWEFATKDQRAAQRARRDFVDYLLVSGVDPEGAASAEIIFGELAANVARHAPGMVDIALEWRDEKPILHVVDRGTGYQVVPLRTDALAESGRGLWLVQHVGGKLNVEVIPGFGTHTRATLPIQYSAALRTISSA